MTNSLSILGSTGSIGTQAIDVAQKLNMKVTALTANTNVKLIDEQIRLLKPELAVMYNEESAKALKIAVGGSFRSLFHRVCRHSFKLFGGYDWLTANFNRRKS